MPSWAAMRGRMGRKEGGEGDKRKEVLVEIIDTRRCAVG